MVTERDKGKRCRLVRDGEWGESHLRTYGKEAFSWIFRIIGVSESQRGFLVQLEQISPKAPYTFTPRWYVERVELIDDDELDILT